MGDNKPRTALPTDMQVVREFIAEAEAFRAESKDRINPNDATGMLLQGNADAREALAARLQYMKEQRAEMVAEAAEKVAEGFVEMGRKVSESLKTAFDKANTKADK